MHFQRGGKLQKIGVRCFAWSSLEWTKTPQSLRVIEDGAFLECRSLKRVILDTGLEALGGGEGD